MSLGAQTREQTWRKDKKHSHVVTIYQRWQKYILMDNNDNIEEKGKGIVSNVTIPKFKKPPPIIHENTNVKVKW